MTVAAKAVAERKTFAHLSERVAIRRQSFSLPNMILIRLRLRQRRLSERTVLPRDFRPGMQGNTPLSFNVSRDQSALAGSLEPVAQHWLDPPFPTVVERLGQPILSRRIAPKQPIAVDEDYSVQHTPIIDHRLAMALRKERLQPLQLLVCQPE